MSTIIDYLNISAAGTSEGVRKAWDTRGRGRRSEYSNVPVGKAHDYLTAKGFKLDNTKTEWGGGVYGLRKTNRYYSHPDGSSARVSQYGKGKQTPGWVRLDNAKSEHHEAIKRMRVRGG